MNPATLQRYAHQGFFPTTNQHCQGFWLCQTELHSAKLPIPVPAGCERKAATAKDPQMFLTPFTRKATDTTAGQEDPKSLSERQGACKAKLGNPPRTAPGFTNEP